MSLSEQTVNTRLLKLCRTRTLLTHEMAGLRITEHLCCIAFNADLTAAAARSHSEFYNTAPAEITGNFFVAQL